MNKKYILRILLAILLLTAVIMLSGCSYSGTSPALGLYQMFGGLIITVLGFIVSIFSAIVSAILGVLLFVLGIINTIVGVIGTVINFVVGIF